MKLSDVPERVINRVTPFVPDRWEDKCVLWHLSVGGHGYGQIGWGGNAGRGLILAHRLSYLMFRGEIPDDMTVDHTCYRRDCWNPNHLRLLSNVANGTDNGNKRKTHCPRNHPYSGDNLRIDKHGHRYCRECQLMWSRGFRVADDNGNRIQGTNQKGKATQWLKIP